MKKRFKFSLSIEVDTPTPGLAKESIVKELLKLVGDIREDQIHFDGFVHQDGMAYPYTPAPEGFEVTILTSEYNGSHWERGYDDEVIAYFAFPSGQEVELPYFSHASSSYYGPTADEYRKLWATPNLLIFVTEAEGWFPISEKNFPILEGFDSFGD
jgi:hypothetical protein